MGICTGRGGSSDVTERRVSGDYVESGVERRATLADSILLREMEQITGAIRETHRVARDECRLVVWARYGLAINWTPPEDVRSAVAHNPWMTVWGLAGVLGMDESTFHRYRPGFVYGAAERLGWF